MPKPTEVIDWDTNGTNVTVPPADYVTDGWGGSSRKVAVSAYMNYWKKHMARYTAFMAGFFGDNGLITPSQTRWEPAINNGGAQNANVTSINWNVGLLATANAAQAYFPSVIDLRPGDRVTGVHAYLVGDGTVQNVTASLYSFGAGGRSLIGTVTAVNPAVYGGAPVKYSTTGLTYTISTDLVANFDAGLFWDVTMPHRTGSSTAVYSVGITFDRPNG